MEPKYIIWNKTLDMFWDNEDKEWNIVEYATEYTLDELKDFKAPRPSGFQTEVILAVIALNL